MLEKPTERKQRVNAVPVCSRCRADLDPRSEFCPRCGNQGFFSPRSESKKTTRGGPKTLVQKFFAVAKKSVLLALLIGILVVVLLPVLLIFVLLSLLFARRARTFR